jgi:hypothetical protein
MITLRDKKLQQYFEVQALTTCPKVTAAADGTGGVVPHRLVLREVRRRQGRPGVERQVPPVSSVPKYAGRWWTAGSPAPRCSGEHPARPYPPAAPRRPDRALLLAHLRL